MFIYNYCIYTCYCMFSLLSVYAVLEFSKFFFTCNYRNFLSSRDINSTIVSPAVSHSKCLFCFCKDSLSRCCQTFGQNEVTSFELFLRGKNFLAFSVADDHPFWPVNFWPVKLASYFMQIRFEVSDLKF